MSSIKSKRNVKVELLRVIACILVIWYHIRPLPLAFKPTGELSETAIFFECICTVCVMTFFLITGFFIYDREGGIIKSWLYFLKNFFIKIFPPFIIVSIICIVFHNYLISEASFMDCIHNFSFSRVCDMLLASLRSFSTDPLPGTAAHMWYIYAYFYIILVYPITRFIIKKLPECTTYIVLIIITIIMVLNDYNSFYGDSIYYMFFDIVKKPVYYSVVGYMLYHKIIKRFIDEKLELSDKNSIIINYKVLIIAIIMYVVTFILLFKTEVRYCLTTNNGYVYTSWLSLYSLILTIAFVLIIYDINIDLFVNDKIRKTILFLSGKTLGIYLIHYLVVVKLSSIGFQNEFTKRLTNIVHHFLYYTIYSLIIFVISLAIVSICGFIKKLLIGGVYVIKEKRLS